MFISDTAHTHLYDYAPVTSHYVKIIVNFSLTFDNLRIQFLYHKLAEVITSSRICCQISDILTERKQMVWQGSEHLGPLVINTGAP